MFEATPAVIYCDLLLPYSATFIRSQAEALNRYVPYYVGCRLINGLELPQERTLPINKGSLTDAFWEAGYKFFGKSPYLVSALRPLKPAFIHAHFGPDGLRALPLARTLKIPLIVTFHGYDATLKDEYAKRSTISHRTYLKRRAKLQEDAHLFIAVSEFIKSKLLAQGFSSDKVVVHYIGVDTQLFQPNLTIPREPVVLFTGRLVEKKGCEYLIRAMSLVQEQHPNVQLIVIGDGPLRADLEALAEATLKRFTFTGKQPPEVVRAWMNRAKIFCVPSIVAKSGDAEAFGIVFIEAQAMGLPVVSFASGGIPEAVIHDQTGLLAPEKDWRTLGHCITQLLNKEALWQVFSQQGYERVREKFDLHRQSHVLEAIYNSVLE